MDRALFWFRPAAALALVAASGGAYGQLNADFEAPTYNGSAAGTILTGQNGWYLPVAGSADGLVMTYAGNTQTIAPNPNGGAQFEIGIAGGNAAFARAQHAVAFAEGVWEASWDCTGKYVGTAVAEDNIGSFSLQPSASAKYFQQLMSWGPTLATLGVTDHTANHDAFHIAFGFYNAGMPTGAVPLWGIASTAWQDLPVDHWYHCTVRWNFTTAQITRVSIRDITAGTPEHVDDVTALDWYLQGGPNSTMPLPTDVRLFAGGGAGASPPGNVTAWDNLVIAPFSNPPSCYANCDGSTTVPFLNVLDFNCFVNRFQQGESYANCDGSTTPPVLNVLDFNCFVNAFSGGCSAP